MQSEIEAKFLNLSHDDIRSKLTNLGAKLEVPMRLMRRAVLDYPDKRLQKANWGRLRVRDEGDKITVTYKSGGDSEYSKEIETTIGSYDKMIELLKAIGLEAFAFQESKRETWLYKGVEVVLDEWPWLNPYIEIEGPSEESIKEIANALELKWEDAAFGNIDTAYRHQYIGMGKDETINILPKVSFDDPIPQWLSKRKTQ